MVVKLIEAKEDKITIADLIDDLKKVKKLIILELFLLLKVLFVEKKKTLI
nr:hypothetical protein [Methanobrevibacter oralis]